MSYEKVAEDFSSFNEPIYILGESDNYEFYYTRSRFIVKFKNEKNPFLNEGKYTNELKGKILDELINTVTLVEEINKNSFSCLMHRRETMEQTE